MVNNKVLGLIIAGFLVGGCGGTGDEDDAPQGTPDLATAEAFVDAFYSFDPDRLSSFLSSAGESGPRILSYQGWAEGAHYEIVERMPCEGNLAGAIRCSLTVRDDSVGALGLGWWVTDHFDLIFQDGEIVSVETSSNDPQVYHDAIRWVQGNRPELISEPCEGVCETGVGVTPGLCAAAMKQGYLEFVESDEFPEELPATPGG